MRNRISFLAAFIFLLLACGRYDEFKNSATANYSDDKLQKFAKYMIQGKSLYKTHCSNCHQEDGTGLGKVFPPLRKADYLLNDKARAICIVKNGKKGKITVNGIDYNQEMLANERLSDLEIAEICTYIYNSWGNEQGMISLGQVKESLNNCSE